MPLRPMTFGDFLSLPFKAIRYNKAVLVGGPLVCYLIVTLAMGLALWMLISDLGSGFFSYDYSADYTEDPTAMEGPRGETILALVITGILLLLSDVFSRAIITPGIARAVLGERISLATAWGLLRKRVWHLLGLYGLATLAMLAVLCLFVLGYVMAYSNDSAGGALLLLLFGFPLMLAVALVYNIFIGIAVPVIVLERGRVGAAFGRTVRLIKGRFWWTVLITFVAGLFAMIASYLVQTVLQMVGMVALFALPQDEVLGLGIFAVSMTLAYLIQLVLQTTYVGSTFTFVYVDLRIRHEGFDAELAEAAEARARR